MSEETGPAIGPTNTAGEASEAPPDDSEASTLSTDTPELHKIRREAGNLRTRLRQTEQELEAARAASLGEAEQLRQQLADLKTQMQSREVTFRQQNARHQVESAARDLGIADPLAAWKLLEPSALEFDDTGSPTNVAQALEALLAKHPILTGAAQSNVTNPPRAAGAPSLTRQALAKMSPDEINNNWDAISAQLAEKTR
jgi:hypothetical protein